MNTRMRFTDKVAWCMKHQIRLRISAFAVGHTLVVDGGQPVGE